MTVARITTAAVGVGLSALLAGCSAENSLGFAEDHAPMADYDEAASTSATGTVDDGDLGAEEEDDFLALPPAQTDVYVFIANPERDTITRVNVTTNEVRTTTVGIRPTVVETTPDYQTAVVFNQGEDSVTIVDAATLDISTVGVRDNFNRMVMSPDGLWVALWHDVDAVRPGDDPPDGLQSFNETSFVNVATEEHFPMAVGFNPRMVVFTPDGELAAVVSDEYLSLVDLTADEPAPTLIQLTGDLIDIPEAEEVVLAPTGDYAFVRQFDVTSVLVVDLLSHVVDSIPVGDNPTDLDLSPDGTEAVVVTRGSRELYILQTDDPFAPPEVLSLPDELPLGSLLFDPTGEQAVVYTTATLTDRYVTWDLATDEIVQRALEKPVTNMAITPTGDSMLAFHTQDNALGADPDSPFYDAWAITMISLDSFVSNPLRLDAEPIGYANANNGNFGYFIMDATPVLVELDYTTLLHENIALNSTPVYVGVLPDLDTADGEEPPAWVSQEHPLGRISFYDADDRSVETITGFELNSHIED